jgi:hypothetical protein
VQTVNRLHRLLADLVRVDAKLKALQRELRAAVLARGYT